MQPVSFLNTIVRTSSAARHSTRGHRIALYFCAFLPPHAAYYVAVSHLHTLSQIAEVVVIISNRCRPIPGTTLALDATIAQRIWSIYLQGIKKVRVEVASHTAVSHAFEYFGHAEVGDTLLFCLGEADIGQGDDRFRNLESFARQSGIQAKVIPVPTGSIPTRSTSLRAALTQGDTGQKEFIAALPTHITDTQREEVWVICREGMREMDDLIKEKVYAFINRTRLGEIEDLRSTVQGKMDQVFRVRFKDGRCLFVKYAGDAVGTEKLGQSLSLKPRKRLSVERKVLKWLRAKMQSNIEIPEIVHFEKKTWTLVLTEVCPGGRRLHDDLQAGIFDPMIAKKASQFLAECHTMTQHIPPLWGDAELDQQHWKRMLALRTVELTCEIFPNEMSNDLAALQLASGKSEENRFVHLNFHPKNILLSSENIGMIDFELSSSVGDPAYDIGSFLGHYIYWSLMTIADHASQSALQMILETYQQRVGNLWHNRQDRVVGFAGAALLSLLKEKDSPVQHHLRNLFLCTGSNPTKGRKVA